MSFEDYLEEGMLVSHLDCLEKLLQKAKTLMKPYKDRPIVVINNTTYEEGIVGFYSSRRGQRYHQYLSVVRLNEGEPFIAGSIDGELYDLRSFFENVADPTEVELGNFEQETGHPFILSEKGLKSIFEMCSPNFTRLTYNNRPPSTIKVRKVVRF